MGNLFGIWGDDDKNKTENTQDEKLRLRQEELDINKSKMQTAEVILTKDVVEEQKTFYFECIPSIDKLTKSLTHKKFLLITVKIS